MTAIENIGSLAGLKDSFIGEEHLMQDCCGRNVVPLSILPRQLLKSMPRSRG